MAVCLGGHGWLDLASRVAWKAWLGWFDIFLIGLESFGATFEELISKSGLTFLVAPKAPQYRAVALRFFGQKRCIIIVIVIVFVFVILILLISLNSACTCGVLTYILSNWVWSAGSLGVARYLKVPKRFELRYLWPAGSLGARYIKVSKGFELRG